MASWMGSFGIRSTRMPHEFRVEDLYQGLQHWKLFVGHLLDLLDFGFCGEQLHHRPHRHSTWKVQKCQKDCYVHPWHASGKEVRVDFRQHSRCAALLETKLLELGPHILRGRLHTAQIHGVRPISLFQKLLLGASHIIICEFEANPRFMIVFQKNTDGILRLSFGSFEYFWMFKYLA